MLLLIRNLSLSFFDSIIILVSQNAENGILGLQKYQNFLGEHTLRLLFSLIPWVTLIHTCCQATSIFIENTGSNNDIFNL